MPHTLPQHSDCHTTHGVQFTHSNATAVHVTQFTSHQCLSLLTPWHSQVMSEKGFNEHNFERMRDDMEAAKAREAAEEEAGGTEEDADAAAGGRGGRGRGGSLRCLPCMM